MKQILLLPLLCSLSAHFLQAQEQQCNYIPYQDSMFLLRCITITDSGFEGIADTTVTYSTPPLDSVQLRSQITVNTLNRTNSMVARMRNNVDFRFLFAEINATDALLDQLGGDYYTETVAREGAALHGRYRIVTDTSRFVTIGPHPNPTRPDLLRATDDVSNEGWNVRVVARDLIQIVNYDGVSYFLSWDGVSSERKVYREPVYFMPVVFGRAPVIQMVKL